MSGEIPYYYLEPPKRSFNLESCWGIESKTRQFPFVVASDIAISRQTSPAKVVSPEHETGNSEIPTPAVSYSDLLKGALTGHFVKPPQVNDGSSAAVDSSINDEQIDSKREASREFLVFHDVEHYLTLKDQYPHCHEIIRCPLSYDVESQYGEKRYRDDLCRGRLIFDFDLEVPLPEMESICKMKSLGSTFNNQPEMMAVDPILFVPPNFKTIIEQLVVLVFQNYYHNVDVKRLMFVWQITRHLHKFSMHLIVKHAYFSEDWVKQSRIFYCLFCRVATLHGVGSIIKAIDLQMARRNATFRILGCSKIGGKVLELDSCMQNGRDLLSEGYPLTIYDCLVGVYHVDQLKDEQSISMDNINYLAIDREVDKSKTEIQTEEVKDFQRGIKKQIKTVEENREALNLDDKCIEMAVALFDRFNDGTFVIRDQVGSIINLNRSRAAPCPISGIKHDNENAYLRLRGDGRLIFVCRRGCKKGNFYGLDLGEYRQSQLLPLPSKGKEEADDSTIVDGMVEGKKETRPRVIPINRKKMEAVAQAQVLMVGVDIENPGTFIRKKPVKTPKTVYSRSRKPTAKRATAIHGNQPLLIPEGLRFPQFMTAK